jgi:hypothetical protein
VINLSRYALNAIESGRVLDAPIALVAANLVVASLAGAGFRANICRSGSATLLAITGWRALRRLRGA